MEKTPDVTRGNGADHPTFEGCGGHCARRPVAERTRSVLRGLTRQRHALPPLLRAASGGGSRTRGVLAPLAHRAVLPCQPVAAPASDREAAGSQEACHLAGSVSVRQGQHDLGTDTAMLGRFMGTEERAEGGARRGRAGHWRRLGTRHQGLLDTQSRYRRGQTHGRESFYLSLAVA